MLHPRRGRPPPASTILITRRARRARLRHAFAALIALLCALLPSPAAADSLGSIRKSAVLRWGGDQEGGGPYIFPRDDDPAEVTGFEVDLARRLGERLGARATFTQGQWDKLPDMLRTGKIDVILNGYELVPEHAEVMSASVPYYVFALQLMARRGDARIASWDDLPKRPGNTPLKVGVLTGSAAERVVRRRCGEACEIISYDGNTDAMREVETGKLDATVQDTPIAAFYGPRFPGLAAVGVPVDKGYYVAYVPKGEAALLRALNESIVDAIRSGEIERIDRHYGIWNDQQAELAAIAAAARFYGYPDTRSTSEAATPAIKASTTETITLGARARGWEVVRRYGGTLLQSAGLTVILSVLAFPLAIAAGLLIALGRVYGPRWLAAPLRVYVEFLRGTPLMLQLYFIFFILPEIGVRVPAFWTGVVGLAINYSAYESEIYRAGLQAIPAGQMEAALSLGMSRGTALRRVIVPQAVRLVVPPVVNDFIALFKDTSVCSVITLVELTKRFSVLSLSTQATLELMALTALLYLLMSFPLSLISRRIEARMEAR